MLGPVSTWMGDRLGTLGAVGTLLTQFLIRLSPTPLWTVHNDVHFIKISIHIIPLFESLIDTVHLQPLNCLKQPLRGVFSHHFISQFFPIYDNYLMASFFVAKICLYWYFLSFCWYRMQLFTPFSRQRPYHIEHTSSRPITEVKQGWDLLVLGWVTAWEHWVLLANNLFVFRRMMMP